MAKYKIIPSSRTIVQSPISIGHKAEKGVEAIEFDLTAWVETYGSGTATIIMRRWGDAIPYPIALEIDENNKATWTLSDTDTAKAGMAYAQLSYVVGDEVVKKSDIYTFRVMDSLTGEGDPPEAYESWLEHLTHFAAEAMAEVLDIEGIVTDKTLTVDGGIADAKATGDALSALEDQFTEKTDQLKAELGDLKYLNTTDKSSIVAAINEAAQSGGGNGSLTNAVKNALLQIAQKVAYIDDDGQDYYADLYDALYPPADIVSISAVYTQSGVVYDTDTLESLRSDLIVTALTSNQTTISVTDYTLSGTLTEGISTITVSYGEKTTTFTVSVSVRVTGNLFDKDTMVVADKGITGFGVISSYSWGLATVPVTENTTYSFKTCADGTKNARQYYLAPNAGAIGFSSDGETLISRLALGSTQSEVDNNTNGINALLSDYSHNGVSDDTISWVTFTTPSGCNYLLFNTALKRKADDIQLEQGNSINNYYTPYGG